MLFRNNPELITFNSTLSITDATIIKNAVKTVVFDNLATWNVGDFDTTASFTNTPITSLQFQFNNTSTNATSYLWNFGDGTTSTDANPTHTYATNGNYTVALTATKCGISQQNSMAINTLGITEFVKSDFEIYPNPVVNVLKIKTQNENYSIKIYNSISQLVFEGDNTNEVPMSKFDIGIYFVHITSDNQTEAYKIFKK